MTKGIYEEDVDSIKSEYLQDLPQYHFDRDEMTAVFADISDWIYDHMGCESCDFRMEQRGDEYYIIHFPSGTIINWYKHMGRTNTCNKPMGIEDLKEFKETLLKDFRRMI